MKKIVLLFILFQINCFSQSKIEWNNIKGIAVYRLSKQYSGDEIELRKLNLKTPLNCNTENLKTLLSKVEKPKIDILIEKSNLLFLINFKDRTERYLVYKKSGILIQLSDSREYFFIRNNSEFNKFIKNLKV